MSIWAGVSLKEQPKHRVAMGLSSGEVLEEFDRVHPAEGFEHFFARLATYEQQYACSVAVATEGFNGYARPLDTMIRARDSRLSNINNLKRARFKAICPGAAKSDSLDARKGLELFQLRDHLPLAKDVLQEVAATPEENDILKRLTRRRRQLVREKSRVLNRLQSDLQAVCPGLLEITNDAGNRWVSSVLNQPSGADSSGSNATAEPAHNPGWGGHVCPRDSELAEPYGVQP